MSEKSKKQKVSIVEKMGLFMVCALSLIHI